ncbi:MAG: histidine phosphatase family protein [Proteobacteria bacterium]|nr:histidine phosphatase family protein [Pseudomonadota bacterium]
MRTLFLMRHAKSAWDDAPAEDHDRPLDARGERAALVIGRYLRQQGAAPEVALLSTARRVRETFELVVSQLARAPTAEWRSDLYLADEEQMLAGLKRLPATAADVLMIGHNPGTALFAARFAGRGERDALASLARRKFPTAALAIFRIAKAWAKLRFGDAEAVSFVLPKDLV